jgi:hypothetical protein
MITQPGSALRRLLPASRTAAAALVAALALSLAGAACFGGDDDDGSPTPAGALVTTTPAAATATSQPQPGGTLAPASPSPAVTVTVQAPPQATPGVAAMLDMAPCAEEKYYEVQTAGGGVPALTYKGVPEGTPILFPFQEGRLKHVDAREGAILLFYEVEGVGVLSVQAAGSNTLDRLVAHPVAGTVIGHFAGTFGEEETDVFEGYQLFAVAGTTDLVVIGDQLFAGEPLQLQVEDCVVLP